MDYNQVLSQLFVGSYPESRGDIDRLRQESDITAILNLQTDEDMSYFKIDWERLQMLYAARGITVQRVPVKDFDPADLREKLPACVKALNDLLAAGHSVYVHCSAGVNRSPTVVIAYLYWCRDLDLNEAAAYVNQRRSCSPDVEAIRLATQDLLNEPSNIILNR
jgi:hypothetical protein